MPARLLRSGVVYERKSGGMRRSSRSGYDTWFAIWRSVGWPGRREVPPPRLASKGTDANLGHQSFLPPPSAKNAEGWATLIMYEVTREVCDSNLPGEWDGRRGVECPCWRGFRGWPSKASRLAGCGPVRLGFGLAAGSLFLAIAHSGGRSLQPFVQRLAREPGQRRQGSGAVDRASIQQRVV